MATPKRRVLFTDDARFAATPAANGQPAMLEGYALVWNQLSTDRGGYKVRLLPGSAKFETPTNAYLEHDFRQLLGTSANQSLILETDNTGVKVTIKLPDTTLGRDTFTLVRDKYISGMSFAMVEAPWAAYSWGTSGPSIVPVPGSATVTQENGETIVTVNGGFVVDEVTITSRPAFLSTVVDVAKPEPASYAARTRQANQLQQFKLDRLRQAGPGLARAAR